MEKIVLLGCGGHAKSMIDTIEANGDYEIVGFLNKDTDNNYEYRNYKIIGIDDDLYTLYKKGVNNVAICVGFLGGGGDKLRQKLYENSIKLGLNCPAIIDRSANIATDAIIGRGVYIGKNVVVNSESNIGNMCIINTGAIIEHECKIGEYSHVSVGSVLCGNVNLGEGSFIGANSTVIQGISIGREVIIGAGMLVINDIQDFNKMTALTNK